MIPPSYCRVCSTEAIKAALSDIMIEAIVVGLYPVTRDPMLSAHVLWELELSHLIPIYQPLSVMTLCKTDNVRVRQ